MKRFVGLILLFISVAAQAQLANAVTDNHWVGTWATAQQPVVKSFMPYNNNMSGRSVRQIVKVSIGGKQLRLELSNELSREPLVIRSVYIAHAARRSISRLVAVTTPSFRRARPLSVMR